MSDIPRKNKGLVFIRDGGACIRCGSEGELNFHHRKLRSQSSKAEVHNGENVILLCGSGTTGCHGWVHAHPKESYEAGWMVRSWASPLDVPYLSDGSLYQLDDNFNRTITERKAA